MKTVKFLALLLSCACLLGAVPENFGTAWAATPDQVWQDYQKQPDVSTNPHKSTAPKPAPHITVEDKTGRAAVPTTPEQAKEKAEASAAEATVKVEEPQQKAAENTVEIAAENAAAASVTTPPKVSNVPVNAKPKPKRRMVKNPPLPKAYMRMPQAGDFVSVSSVAGGYSLLLPKAFGADPLADLPGVKDIMLTRIADNNLLCAATTLAADTTDNKNYLPDYAGEGKKVLLRWQHGVNFIWDCCLSKHVDFYGEKLLLEAGAEQSGKAYRLLYVLPKASLKTYLPQALQSLDSFALAE